jgi:RimJ/RimL family protein N-acetyltransferase
MKPLKGMGVWLRPIGEDDLAVLFRWRNTELFMSTCMGSVAKSRSRKAFRAELVETFATGRHVQMMVLDRHNTPVGTIFSYFYDPTHKNAFVTIYIDPAYTNRGYGAAAFYAFTDFLFRKYRLFKTYSDVFDYNARVIDQLLRLGLKEEGRFRGHQLYKGRRHDLVRLALYPRDAATDGGPAGAGEARKGRR